MKLNLPFKELTLPENAYDKQLHRDLAAKVNELAKDIPAYEAFEQAYEGQIVNVRYGYGGKFYMPYGWHHPSWTLPLLRERNSRGRPAKIKHPLCRLAYIYCYDAVGKVISVEYRLPGNRYRKKSKYVTYFVRQDDEVTVMYTFSDFSQAGEKMRLYSVAWKDDALKRQHIVTARWSTDGFKADCVSTEICYTLEINGKSCCDRYEYDTLTDNRFQTTLDYESLDFKFSDLSKV